MEKITLLNGIFTVNSVRQSFLSKKDLTRVAGHHPMGLGSRMIKTEKKDHLPILKSYKKDTTHTLQRANALIYATPPMWSL